MTDERYWGIFWGDPEDPILRGPYERSTLEKACMNAYGDVAPSMLAVDLGPIVSRVRVQRNLAAMSAATRERFKHDRGVFRWLYSTNELEKLGDWKDEPYVRLFKTKLDRSMAMRPVSEIVRSHR